MILKKKVDYTVQDFISLLILLTLNLNCFSQIIKVVDKDSKEKLPFAIITIDSLVFYSDSEGNFESLKGDELKVRYLGYEEFITQLPINNDTIFMSPNEEQIEEIVIQKEGKPFQLGALDKNQKSSFTNGAINRDVYKYFEYIKSFQTTCTYFKLNKIKFLLANQISTPYRINFYSDLNYDRPDYSVIINEKQNKGLATITIDKFFESEDISIGFEWLPDENYEITKGKLNKGENILNMTNFSLGLSKNILLENESTRVTPNSIPTPRNNQSDPGLILKLYCTCYE